MRIAFLTPPVIKPVEPGLSAAAAASRFQAWGLSAFYVDASLGWFLHALGRPGPPLELARAQAERGELRPGLLQAMERGAEEAAREPGALRSPGTYRDRRVYSSAVSHLVNALRLQSLPFPGFSLRVGDLEVAGMRPHASEDLLRAAGRPGPFDAYFLGELLPRLEAEGVSHVALSLTFLNQAYPTFRLAALLRDRMPGVQRLLGGPLPACWKAVGADLASGPFALFHRVFAQGTEAELGELAAELGGRPLAAGSASALLAPPLMECDWSGYLAPLPTVPLALGQGCYWARCTFCPDYLHPRYRPCGEASFGAQLEAVAERFPGGAMLHLTDSALPPALLARLADEIAARRLPFRWHGFARLEPAFGEDGLAERLAAGGCAMLQWGLETASPRLLKLMGKGVDPAGVRQVLRACADAGIRNHAYLLFGLPTETDADREATLDFVCEEADRLHDLNTSLLNLPRRSPMHAHPARFGITEILPFGEGMDLSLYDDFRCGDSHPRLEARRWLHGRFLKDPAVKGLLGDLNGPFKANHGCFL